MGEEDIDVVRRMLDAFNDGDVDGVIAAFHERCEIKEPSEMPDTPATGFHGHAGVREWMANLRDVVGVRFEPRSFASHGDVIVSEWSGSGLGPSSGVPFEWRTYVLLHMREGRIARARAFLSEQEAAEAAGPARR
jgi:ketosteroid isomerase-like protein